MKSRKRQKKNGVIIKKKTVRLQKNKTKRQLKYKSMRKYKNTGTEIKIRRESEEGVCYGQLV